MGGFFCGKIIMKINQAETNTQNIFTSSDLALTTVVSLFFPIVAINKQNPRKAEFLFNRTKELNEFIDRYWKKELLVEPRAYFDQLKAIKARLYAND